MSMLVKLVNTSDTDFSDRFNGTVFRVKAHDAELVPDGAMKTWLGDPDCRNLPRNRARADELMRIKARVGAYGDRESQWDELKPPLEAFDMEGNRIWTVTDDPEGTQGGGGATVYTIEQISEIAVNQGELIKRLQAQLDERDYVAPDPTEPDTSSLPPADNPNRVQVVGK